MLCELIEERWLQGKAFVMFQFITSYWCFVCLLLFYATSTVFQLYHGGGMMYEMRRRKPKPFPIHLTVESTWPPWKLCPQLTRSTSINNYCLMRQMSSVVLEVYICIYIQQSVTIFNKWIKPDTMARSVERGLLRGIWVLVESNQWRLDVILVAA